MREGLREELIRVVKESQRFIDDDNLQEKAKQRAVNKLTILFKIELARAMATARLEECDWWKNTQHFGLNTPAVDEHIKELKVRLDAEGGK
jgi:hypothetical protein